MAEETPVTLLRTRISELGQNSRTLFTIYISWFSFFWTLNSGVLAWIFVNGKGTQLAFIPWMFLCLCMLGVGACIATWIAMKRMTAEVRRATEAISDTLSPPQPLLRELAVRPIWPPLIIAYAQLGGCLTMVLLAAAWIYLGVAPTSAPAGPLSAAASAPATTTLVLPRGTYTSLVFTAAGVSGATHAIGVVKDGTDQFPVNIGPGTTAVVSFGPGWVLDHDAEVRLTNGAGSIFAVPSAWAVTPSGPVVLRPR